MDNNFYLTIKSNDIQFLEHEEKNTVAKKLDGVVLSSYEERIYIDVVDMLKALPDNVKYNPYTKEYIIIK